MPFCKKTVNKKKNNTQEKLTQELQQLHRRIAAFEALETEHKRTEKALQESALQYRTTLNSMGDAIHVIDADFRFVLFNDAFRQWNKALGLETEVIGWTVFEIFPFLPDTVRDEYRHVFDTGETLVTEENTTIDDRVFITETRKIPILEGGRVTQVVTVIRNITDRKHAEEALRHSYDQMRETFIATVNALASTVEMKDPYTAGHQRWVTRLACAIAEEMGFSGEQIEGIRMAGLIHDIGKINIPTEILSKPGHLSEIQYNMVKVHPQIGCDILREIKFPWPVAEIVLQHHERMDGSGYPQGLSGEEIILEARILAVADAVEAMSSHRPYRVAHGIERALEEISRNRGTLYDPEVVDACLRLFEKGFRFD
jgi:PAS domain S-box-containing protein/putative nucleotidyltransferase with HDIG domain